MTCICGHADIGHSDNGRCVGECYDADLDTTYRCLCHTYRDAVALCRCGHPRHHHHGGCHTETVTGPASNKDTHQGRTVTACQCPGFEAPHD